MSIFIKTKSGSPQDRLFTHHLNNVKNCKCGMEVLSVSNNDGCYDTEKSSVFIFDVENAEDAKTWIAYIKNNPFDEVDLDVEQILIELRLNKNMISDELKQKAVENVKQTDLTI